MNGQMEGCTGQGVGEGRELLCPLLSTPPSRKLHVFSNLDALQTPAFRILMDASLHRRD